MGDVIVPSQDEDTKSISQHLEDLDLGSESNSEDEESVGVVEKLRSIKDSDDIDTTKVEFFTELMMRFRGSSYHSSFQGNLSQCNELLMKKETVNVRLHFEPTNRRDENAIVVQVQLVHASNGSVLGEKMWQPIEYIPGPKKC